MNSRFHGEKIHFVTGRLAEPALRRVIPELKQLAHITPTIQVLPITVAALMTPGWIAKHLQVPAQCDRIVLPGYCQGDLEPITEITSVPVELGPKDVRQLPDFFGHSSESTNPLESFDIEIVAEINHVPRLSMKEILAQAAALKAGGADVIDVGCLPGAVFLRVGDVVKALIDQGHRVSIDSLHPQEIGLAVQAGAELVLSVNSSNRRAAQDWGCEVVVIPDDPEDWLTLSGTIEFLAERNVPMRIDPVLNPIGLGFVDSLYRYMQVRQIWPEAEMLMGIGNLTELTDVDSAGVNVLLLAICQELGIRSVLTTQVINWARSSVQECDLARRLVHYAVRNGVPPKSLSDQLVCLRDAKLLEMSADEIRELATGIKDNNYRILSKNGEIHLLGSRQHWHQRDPFKLFDALLESEPTNVDVTHAFYLGYEMCKAMMALQLGKEYRQDEPLDWGHLTVEENHHRLRSARTPKQSSRKRPK